MKSESTGSEVPLIRVFLSSPGDVANERAAARRLIGGELMGRSHLRGRGALELVAWDDPAARVPLVATESPQESMNAARPRPSECDVVVVVLWSRMGTLLPEHTRKPNRTPYGSGTEWEYEDAVTSLRKPPPVVLIYRRTESPKVDLDDPDLNEKRDQRRKVNAFVERILANRCGVNDYETPDQFEALLGQHLDEYLHGHLLDARRHQPPSRSGPPPIPPDYLAWLQRRCASVELLGQDVEQSLAIKLSNVYVPALVPDADLAESKKGKRRRGVEPAERQPVTLLERIDQVSLYVPAPAGAGKSTFCRWAALQSIEFAATAHPIPAPEEFQEPVPASLRTRLPLLVPLRDFAMGMVCGRGRRDWKRSDLELALAAWVDRSPPPGLDGALLRAHLAAGSAFLLLDGLDEVAVSESRDGASVYPRALLLSGLADALPAWEEAGDRTLLTSRPYGPDEAGLARLGLTRAPLEPLPEPLQALFVTRWFHTLGRPDRADSLLEAMGDRDDLAPLTENPMLLTAVCVLYDKGGRLPEDRYELYKSIVDGVLHSRYPGDAREREPVLRRLEAIAYGMHTGEPGAAPRQTPAAEISWVETERLLAHFAEQNPAYLSGQVEAAVQREELLTRSGLLLPRPNERASFHHLSFQEFLAAQRIARRGETRVQQVIRERATVPEWRPTLLFLFAAQVFNTEPEWGLGLLGRLIEGQDRATVKVNPATAILVAEALELCLAKRYRIPEALTEGFRRLDLHAIEDEIEVQARQTLGLVLGRLGDPRILDLRDPRAYVEVPAGTYPYGKKGATVEIQAPFRIGRHPVTNSQYRAFMEDGGYSEPKWWSGAGWRWLQEQGVSQPRYWRDRRWNSPNQPVVTVSFWEAEACCAWAGGRLPREQEWEAAARGPEGSQYPWGNDWEDGICNTHEAGLGVTSPVGLFPRSRQARLGLEDLAGNVWEWCWRRSEDLEGPRVLRGGSWYDGRDVARCAVRDRLDPGGRYVRFGFRVVCSSPISEP